MSQVILEKSNNGKNSRNKSLIKPQAIPCFQNGAEVSRQFEWLKRRTSLLAHPEIARKNAQRSLENLSIARQMENKKAVVLDKLEYAIEKLKDARKEIQEAVLAALEMNEAGDDIADQIIVSVAAIPSNINAETTIGQAHTYNRTPQILAHERKEAEKPLYIARYE
jgi:hypothetical protein